MPFEEKEGLRFFYFEAFREAGIKHAVFTRTGGVSVTPWNSLNFGFKVGDDRASVLENHEKAFKVLGCDSDLVFNVNQVHGADVVVLNQSNSFESWMPDADGVITNQKDVTLLMRFADCVPIMLLAPSDNIIGIVHAGWRGTVKKVVGMAVSKFEAYFSVDPAKIVAGIGPCITADYYEVGHEVVTEVYNSFPDRYADILKSRGNSVKMDLVKANQIILEEKGVKEIEFSGLCTASDLGNWYSHRTENGLTGRFGAAITLG